MSIARARIDATPKLELVASVASRPLDRAYPGFTPVPSQSSAADRVSEARAAYAVDIETLELADLADQLVQHRDVLVLPLARTGAVLCEKQAWSLVGYRNVHDFARQKFDRTGRWLQDLGALGRRFQELPALVRAVTGQDGGRPLGQQAALWITRVATSETLGDWIEKARRLTLDELCAEVRAFRNKNGRDVRDEDPNLKPKRRIRFEVPPEVRVALDEAQDLYRASAAHEGSLASFLDALSAESIAAGLEIDEIPVPEVEPADPARPAEASKLRPHPVRWGKHGSPIFEKRRRSKPGQRAWAPPDVPAVRRARRTLREMRDTVRRLERLEDKIESLGSDLRAEIRVSGSKLLDMIAILRALVRIDDEIEIRVAELLQELTERRAWKSLGYTSLEDFAGARLRMSRTTAHSRVALSRGLRRFALVRDAYESGSLSLSAAAWVARACRRRGVGRKQEDEQRAWIDHARGTTMKTLRDEERLLVRDALLARAEMARPVSRHGTTSDKRFHAGTLGEDGARSTRGMASSSGDTSFREPAVLHGSTSAEEAQSARGMAASSGDTSFRDRSSQARLLDQFGIPDEETWRKSIARFPGRSIERVFRLGYALLERVAERSPLVPILWSVRLPEDTAGLFRACLKAMRWHLHQRALHADTLSAAQDARLRASERIARTLVLRHEHVPDWLGLLGMIEIFVLGCDDLRRAKSRYFIAYRDGFRCTAPACTARCTQDHHIVYRSELKNNDPSNRMLLCPFHHLHGEHGILAQCTGTAPLNITWRLGRSDMATWFYNERMKPEPPVSLESLI